MAQTKNDSEILPEDFSNPSADNALIEPKQDRLGYAPFAKHLADSICQMNFPEGFVIAVYGSSGFGKSTLLNFLTYYLKQKPESEQPIIVPFNPWLFSGNEDITRRFIGQLQTVLSQFKAVPKGFLGRITNLAKAVSEIPIPYAQASKAIVKLFYDKEKETSELKEEVEDTLEKQHPRIVVTIDDIDRLTAEEINQLFHLIKAIPNFTNVVYLLVFAQEVVIKALADTQPLPGEVYLDQIVQTSFELPLPDKTSLRRLLFEKLNSILTDAPKPLFNQNRWGNIYLQGIDHFITNPRDIARLTNILTVTYPAVKGEVNPVDFIAIESLRAFRPMIYDIIRKNPKFFAGNADAKGSLIPTLDELKDFHHSWLAQFKDEEKERVKRLLLHLFPKLEAVWHNTYFPAQDDSIWRKQLRICSLDIFPNYFRLVLTEAQFSDADIKAIFDLAKDAKAFGKNLVELAHQKCSNGTTQARSFLERLEDDTEKEIPANCIPSIVKALFDVGDQLLPPEDEPQGMFDFGNDIRIERLISQLLRRIDEQARFETLKEAMSNGNALSIIVHEVAALGQEQGKYGVDESIPEEEWLQSVEHLKELEGIALKRLRDAAQGNSLLQSPKLSENLHYWQSWAGEEEVKQWVEKIIDNDEGLVNFLEKFLQKYFSEYGSNGTQKTGYGLAPNWLEPYLEPSLIVERISRLDETSELTEDRKNAIAQFLREYEMQQQGEGRD
ncbi:P-loop NTPase fold protein [Microcoleus sp. herbarium5]|uniref:P-loop NTPase fold protein n=1 Tax=Microcoleus sp. herbarium5 TaxID=3055434 RepID=UPI002FD61E48